LIRYKKEVGVYELKMIEKNRNEDMESAKKMKKVKKSPESQQSSTKTGVSASAGGHENNNDDDTRMAAVSSSSFPIQNVQIPSMANGGTMTQGPPQIYAPSMHTLTPNELDMARLRLEMELRAIEEAQSLRQQRSQLELHGLNNHGFGTTPEAAASAAAILRANGVGMYGGGEEGGGFGANIAAAELQVQRRNISNILDTGGDHMMAAKEAEMIRRMALGLDSTGGGFMTTATNEIEIRNRLGDLSTITNEAELKNQLGIAGLVGQDHIIASKEDEIRQHIICEAEIRARFGMYENRGEIFESSIDADIRQRLGISGDQMTAFAEADIRKRPGLSGSSMTDYQMATSAEAEIRKRLGLNGQIGDSATAHHEAEIRRRFGLEIEPAIASNHEAEILRDRLSMGSMGDQITSTVPMNDAEFQKRLAAIQNQDLNAPGDASSIGRLSQVASRVMGMGMGMGMGETYEENLLREERIRQQEMLLARFGGSAAASSLYGGISGPGMPMLGGLGRGVPPYVGVGAPGSIGSQSFASAVDTRMASIRAAAAGMSVPMERLTEEELRALSGCRGL
jgi:hypothetical protein